MFKKSGFMHMVNNFKVAEIYWMGFRSFNSLFFVWIWRLGLGPVSSFTWNVVQISCFYLINIFFGFVWRVLIDKIFR